MPFAMTLSFGIGRNRPRLSWGSKSSSSDTSKSTSSHKKKTKKRVRFDRWPPQVIESNYYLTESLGRALWYGKKELMKIRADIEQQLNQSIFDKPARSGEHCYRGLEVLLHEKLSRISSSSSSSSSSSVPSSQSQLLELPQKIRHARFTQSLLEFQQKQRTHGAVVNADEKLRQFCLENSCSKQQQSVARFMAEQDALVALFIYEGRHSRSRSRQKHGLNSAGVVVTSSVKPVLPGRPRGFAGGSLIRQTSVGTRAD